MAKLKVLAIAVATKRVGYAFLHGGDLVDWGGSEKASQSRKNAIKQAERWINQMEPDVVVTEDVAKHASKGARSKRLIASIADLARNLPLSDITIRRVQRFPNKYEEAKALAVQFPQLSPQVPKQRLIWKEEPYSTIFFEALCMAMEAVGPVQSDQ